jgi:hypothetical protein
VKTEIKDGQGTGRTANVTSQNALLVSVLPQTSKGIPPDDLANLRQLREFFVNPAGSEDQIVDGSASSVEFTIQASQSVTKWITGFRIIIQGQNCDITSNDFRRYAQAVGGLTNGIDIEAFQGGVTTSITQAGAIQKLGDFLNYSDDFTGLIAAVSASVDYIQFDFDLSIAPVVLAEGSSDQLIIRINDDLTAALSAADSAQYAIARGYQEST